MSHWLSEKKQQKLKAAAKRKEQEQLVASKRQERSQLNAQSLRKFRERVRGGTSSRGTSSKKKVFFGTAERESPSTAKNGIKRDSDDKCSSFVEMDRMDPIL